MIFEDSSGWTFNSMVLSEEEVGNTATAAKYLKNTHYAKRYGTERATATKKTPFFDRKSDLRTVFFA